MAKQRRREYIIRDILETAMSQALTSSQINLHVGLTSAQSRDYLRYLLEKSLLRQTASMHPGRFLYKCTPRGIRFLEMIKTVSGLLQPEGEPNIRIG